MVDPRKEYLAEGIIAITHHCFFGDGAFVVFPDHLFVSSIEDGVGFDEPEVPASMVSLICAVVRLNTALPFRL